MKKTIMEIKFNEVKKMFEVFYDGTLISAQKTEIKATEKLHKFVKGQK